MTNLGLPGYNVAGQGAATAAFTAGLPSFFGDGTLSNWGAGLNVGRCNQFAEHTRTVRMQVRCNDARVRVSPRESPCLPAGRRAAVENARAQAYEKRNQL